MESNMGLGWGKLYVTIERRPRFFRRKNSQLAIFLLIQPALGKFSINPAKVNIVLDLL